MYYPMYFDPTYVLVFDRCSHLHDCICEDEFNI